MFDLVVASLFSGEERVDEMGYDRNQYTFLCCQVKGKARGHFPPHPSPFPSSVTSFHLLAHNVAQFMLHFYISPHPVSVTRRAFSNPSSSFVHLLIGPAQPLPTGNTKASKHTICCWIFARIAITVAISTSVYPANNSQQPRTSSSRHFASTTCKLPTIDPASSK